MGQATASREIESATRRCVRLARRHYENFPVASLLLPRDLRRPVAVIYAFARSADDLADEGDLSTSERRDRLDAFGRDLELALDGAPVADPVILATAHVIRRHALPAELFRDLLTAFRMDVERTRYAHFHDVMGYCRYSANPVGRLLLHLAGAAQPVNLPLSDAICTALQLINFLQDLGPDYDRHGRIYLPRDEMARYGVTEAHFRDRVSDAALQALVDQQVRRIRHLMTAGRPLAARIPGALGREVALIVHGGELVLNRLAVPRTDLFDRPRLSLMERIELLWRALKAR